MCLCVCKPVKNIHFLCTWDTSNWTIMKSKKKQKIKDTDAKKTFKKFIFICKDWNHWSNYLLCGNYWLCNELEIPWWIHRTSDIFIWGINYWVQAISCQCDWLELVLKYERVMDERDVRKFPKKFYTLFWGMS